MFTKQVDLIYQPGYNTQQFQLLQVNAAFSKLLKQQHEIIIEADMDNKVQFYNTQQTFKLVSINLPTTVLVVDNSGKIHKESFSYLAIQKCKPDTATLYYKLKSYMVRDEDVRNHTFSQIVEEKSLLTSQILHTFKISLQQFSTFSNFANYLQLPGDRWLIIDERLTNKIFYQMINCLTAKGKVLEPFQVDQLLLQLQEPIPLPILLNCLNRFKCQKVDENTYSLSVSSIVRYTINQLAQTKKEYVKSQFDQIFLKLLGLYLPANIEIPKEHAEVSEFFLFIRQKGYLRYYNVLDMPCNIKQLIDHLAKIKYRYTAEEAKGVLRYVLAGKNIEEALIKYFRKFGKEYELKTVTI